MSRSSPSVDDMDAWLDTNGKAQTVQVQSQSTEHVSSFRHSHFLQRGVLEHQAHRQVALCEYMWKGPYNREILRLLSTLLGRPRPGFPCRVVPLCRSYSMGKSKSLRQATGGSRTFAQFDYIDPKDAPFCTVRFRLVSSKAQHKQTRLFLLRHNRSPPHFRSPPAAPFKLCISLRLASYSARSPFRRVFFPLATATTNTRARAATPQEQGTPADEEDLDFQATKLRLEEQLLRNQLKQAEVKQKLKRAKKEQAGDEKSEGRAKKVKKEWDRRARVCT